MNILNNEKFEIFYNFLIETNQKFNLTAITEKNEVYEKHFYDSIFPADEFIENAKIIDVGAGAGFPGIPLKIIREDLNLTLIDSLNKRVNFLNETINKLNLKKIIAIHARAEDYVKTNREKFDYAVARAVAPLNILCEYLAPFVKVGGRIIAYKGTNYQTEIDACQNAFKELKLKLVKVIEYSLPASNSTHSIIVLEKFAKTSEKYPRIQNKPRLQPL